MKHRIASCLTAIGMAAALSCISTAAHADGLKDLKAALARLDCHTPIKGALDVKSWRRTGEGKDADETQGQAAVALEESARGMALIYAPDTLARAEAEQRAHAKDANAHTPTLAAMEEMGANDLRSMLTSAASLQRQLEEVTFKEEKADSFNGNPARLLRFDMPIEHLGEKDRKYVKQYDGTFELWIAADGTPLASRLHVHAAGRALVVISFEMQEDEDNVYSIDGGRLYTTRRVTAQHGSGAGQKSESKIMRTLLVQS